MKNLNVALDDDVIEAVKQAARRDGMIMRVWVERALRDAAKPKGQTQPVRDFTYEPAE